ncbi:MAG: DNA-binding protein [Bacteroidales bacterium]|nr:DNA-binding protein [Bacteroidales bacterium]
MKLKYIFASLLATLAVAAGCEKEADHSLSEIQVSSSYVSLSTGNETNSASITMTTTGSWSIDTSDLPQWLTVSPTSGSAGSSTITFSAPAGEGNSATVAVVCEGKTQYINIIQGVTTVQPATCAEVIAGPDSKTYQVTGICTRIANTNYGNWYLQDATGEIYIYGTVNAAGSYAWSSFGIEVGDEVTVQGPKTTYNGTVELVDVSVVKVNKSLIKVASVDPEDATLPIEGGEFTVNLDNKGDGVYVEIPEDAQSWLSIKSIAGNTVVFKAEPNAGGDRSTTIVLKTVKSGKDYSAEQGLAQKGAIIAATVAEFLEAPVGDTQYRVTGVITKVANASYGNVYVRDFSGEMYVYGIGANGDFEKSGLKVGDIVTLVGKRAAYKDSPQMGGAQLEESISVEEVTIAEFLAKEDSKTVYYMVTGKVDEIANATYGNLYITDGTNRLYVYGCYPGYGATGDASKNWVENAEGGIAVGDTLTMIGYKDTYKETIELCGGIYFSHEKAE